MKGLTMDTHMGNILIDNEVIAQYAGSVAVECFGIVGMAGVNVKDGLVRLLKKDSLTRGITVSLENNKLNLDFHVIVAYGVSIMAVADNLVDNVKYKVEELHSYNQALINAFTIQKEPKKTKQIGFKSNNKQSKKKKTNENKSKIN